MVKRLARGVAEPAHSLRHRAAALLDGLDGYSLLLFRVAWHLGTPNRTDSVQLFVRIPVPAKAITHKLMRHKARQPVD